MCVDETIASYDRIATAYAHRWQDRRVMAAALHRFLAMVPQGGMVLDAGCGPGFDGELLRSYGLRVVGFDLSKGMIQAGLASGIKTPMVQADMRRLPFRASIAGIWCNAALLHLTRRDALFALQEFARVLQAGGVFFLSVKEGQGETQRSDAYGSQAPRYFTYWQDKQLDALLRRSGFTVRAGWTDVTSADDWLCRLALR